MSEHSAEKDATHVVHLDAETLMPVAVSTPCPATTFASLGFTSRPGRPGFQGLTGCLVPCGELAGHDGPHVFHVEWTEEGDA